MAVETPVEAGVQGRIAELEAENTKLAAQVIQLTKQVAELHELLNQNSTHSHLPPSSDGPGAGARAAGPAREKANSKHKRGGQMGRRRAHRKLATSIS